MGKTREDRDRPEGLKEIIRKLHAGASVGQVKRDFAELIKGTSATEVAAMEQALIDEGFPVQEIQRLCEVHVEVFQSALQRSGGDRRKLAGHPVHSLLAENREAAARVRKLLAAARGLAWGLGGPSGQAGAAEAARTALADLAKIQIHYTRKENQLFPYLEKAGFTGPSKVMWGKHDEIRALFKEAEAELSRAAPAAAVAGAAEPRTYAAAARAFRAKARALARSIRRMIFMEERILVPNALAKLSERDWALIRSGEEAIGFAWVAPAAEYDAGIVLARTAPAPEPAGAPAAPVAPSAGAYAAPAAAAGAAASSPAAEGRPDPFAAPPAGVSVGYVSAPLLDLALKRMGVDISVIDENDKVAYYSDSPDRIFPRSPGAIGRDVRNCHPPKSLAVVERILDAFKRKERDSARFWIKMGGRFVVIEYKALYDAEGRYRGTLEQSQEISDLRALEGERRLLDWD